MINIQSIPIEKLKPAPYNPRIPLEPGTPAYQKLERSINEFSLVQPIVWNETTGHIVGGHQRLEILKNQGTIRVDVAVVSLSLEREKALNITLNNSQVGSDWDTEKLIDLVADLHEQPDFDATLTGFNEQDIRDIILIPDPNLEQTVSPIPTEQNLVQVNIEIPATTWENTRPDLDQLIQKHSLTVHITMPN